MSIIKEKESRFLCTWSKESTRRRKKSKGKKGDQNEERKILTRKTERKNLKKSYAPGQKNLGEKSEKEIGKTKKIEKIQFGKKDRNKRD